MITKNYFLFIFAWAATMSVAPAYAVPVTVVFDNPDQVASPGEILMYFGTITDTGVDTVFLNSDDLNINAPAGDFTITDEFFGSVPISLGPGNSSGDIELFDVLVNTPFPDLPTTYIGSYELLGGSDGGASDLLTNPAIAFEVNVVSGVPEPSTRALVAAGISVFAVFRLAGLCAYRVNWRKVELESRERPTPI